MSVIHWGEIWKRGWPTDDGGKPLKPHLMIYLLAYADNTNEDGECYPSIEHVAWKVKRSTRQVKRAKADLLEMGLLEEAGAQKLGWHTFVPKFRVRTDLLPGRLEWKEQRALNRVTSKTRQGDMEDRDEVTSTTHKPSGDPSEGKTEPSLDEALGREPRPVPDPAGKETKEEWQARMQGKMGADAVEATLRARRVIEDRINGGMTLGDRLLRAWGESESIDINLYAIGELNRETIAEKLVSFVTDSGMDLSDDVAVAILERILDPDNETYAFSQRHWQRVESPSFKAAFVAEAMAFVSTGGKKRVRVEGKPRRVKLE